MSDSSWKDTIQEEQESTPSWKDTISEESESSDGISISEVVAPVVTAKATEGLREAIASDRVAGWAEDLAFRAAGGTNNPIGLDLLKEQALSNALKETSPISAVEPMVTPRKVGRAVLDESLLGPLALGGRQGNLTRADIASIKAAQPTNELLKALQTPISKQDIQDRTKSLLNLDKLDPAVSSDKGIKRAFESKQDDFFGFQLPVEAEESKRKLQAGVNYLTPEATAMSSVERAQARATREAVENAAEKEGKLAQFKKLKGISGNIQVAEDLLGSRIKSESPNIISSASGLIGDLVTKRAPGLAAAGLDIANKIARSSVGKALPYLAGAATSGLSMAADEALDSETSGATADMPDYWLEKGIRDPEEQVQKARLFSFKQDLPNQGRSNIMPSPYDKPEVKQYKERVLEADKAGKLKDNYVEKFDSTDEQEIQNFINYLSTNPDDKAASEYSRVLGQIQNAPEREKAAILWSLNQNEVFRNIAKEYKGK
jgi:hypothetical protein